MTKRLSRQEKERRWRIRHIQVISQFAKCNCGKIIPYGHVACKGHQVLGLKLSKADENTRCVICGSNTTRIRKNKKGYSYPEWRIVEGKSHHKCIFMCCSCADHRYYSKNQDKLKSYASEYHKLHREKHLDHMKKYNKKYYQLHMNQIRARAIQRYQSKKEELKG